MLSAAIKLRRQCMSNLVEDPRWVYIKVDRGSALGNPFINAPIASLKAAYREWLLYNLESHDLYSSIPVEKWGLNIAPSFKRPTVYQISQAFLGIINKVAVEGKQVCLLCHCTGDCHADDIIFVVGLYLSQGLD